MLISVKLQTQIPVKIEFNRIDYDSKLVLIGSCFTKNIGDKINYFKFQNSINPFGILFHPKAIETLVVNAISGKEYKDRDVFFHNEQWHCYESHSKLSHASKLILLEALNENIKVTNKQIQEASHIIITLGTAWVYRLVENGVVVANCHKVSQKTFKKELLSVSAIVESLNIIANAIKKSNSKATLILTVSPVRHLKDGFVENTQSKAHLISGIHTFLNQNNRSSYFPSYEIMMDELRDYRFYKQDMLHPNDTAVSYIWECFKKAWIDKKALKTMQEIEAIQKALMHKPINPKSEAHLRFLARIEAMKNKVTKKHPFLQF